MFFVNQHLRVLAVSSHPDDTELGAGGFISRLVNECSAEVQFLILTDGRRHGKSGLQYDGLTRRKEAKAAASELGVTGVTVLDFEDCQLDRCHHALIDAIQQRLFNEDGRREFDLVLTHAGGDMHLDHCHAHDATISAARDYDGVMLFYQAPSTIPNQFKPTFFVTLNDDSIARKKQALMKHVSQREKDFMQNDRIDELARSWAIFHRTPNKRLEAYEVGKSFWDSGRACRPPTIGNHP